jgi:hypothetical protein
VREMVLPPQLDLSPSVVRSQVVKDPLGGGALAATGPRAGDEQTTQRNGSCFGTNSIRDVPEI